MRDRWSGIRTDFFAINTLLIIGGGGFYFVGWLLNQILLPPLELAAFVLGTVVIVFAVLTTEIYAALHRTFGRLLKYLIVGFANTGLDFAILNLLVIGTGVRSGGVLAGFNFISFCVATVHSYFWMRAWVFEAAARSSASSPRRLGLRSRFGAGGSLRRSAGEFGKFWLVTAAGGIVSSVILWSGTAFLTPPGGTPSLFQMNLVKLVAVAVWIAWNFLGYKRSVFTTTPNAA
ncbi:MAG: GtrA family protein [Candidatus Liptonbacteria bacterium]|nr:GtrA family protein [Candidatus Liptonbacteria bacterium]